MSLLGFLGIANAGRAISAMAVIGGLCAGGGFYAGSQWQRGMEAINDRTTLQNDLAALQGAAESLRQHGVDIAQDFQTAARRMDAIATSYEEQVDALDSTFAGYHDALDQYAAARAGTVQLPCLGADGMQLWRDAAAGTAATTANAGRTGAPVRGVPADAADTGGRYGGRNPASVEGSGPAVPPLQDAAREARRGGGDL